MSIEPIISRWMDRSNFITPVLYPKDKIRYEMAAFQIMQPLTQLLGLVGCGVDVDPLSSPLFEPERIDKNMDMTVIISME